MAAPSGCRSRGFPRLLCASPEQRTQIELSPFGLHWDDLDEDISVAGLLAGRGDGTARHRRIARIERSEIRDGRIGEDGPGFPLRCDLGYGC